MNSVTSRDLIVKDYGLKWKLKKNWDLNPSGKWKNLVLRSLSICARSVLINFPVFRPNSPNASVTGWIGIILILPCPMKIIIRFGGSLKNYMKKVKSIAVLMSYHGPEGQVPPIRKWKLSKAESLYPIKLCLSVLRFEIRKMSIY